MAEQIFASGMLLLLVVGAVCALRSGDEVGESNVRRMMRGRDNDKYDK